MPPVDLCACEPDLAELCVRPARRCRACDTPLDSPDRDEAVGVFAVQIGAFPEELRKKDYFQQTCRALQPARHGGSSSVTKEPPKRTRHTPKGSSEENDAVGP